MVRGPHREQHRREASTVPTYRAVFFANDAGGVQLCWLRYSGREAIATPTPEIIARFEMFTEVTGSRCAQPTCPAGGPWPVRNRPR